MAAPPSKQSPSNQEMHESESPDEHRLKDPPPSSMPLPPATAASASSSSFSAVASSSSPPAAAAAPPTYKSSESSESYAVAKQLLNADNFEDALTVIEDELVRTTAAIQATLGLDSANGNGNDANANANADLEKEVELHEALAPLHYLYGTTLLYSLEEARDDGNDTGAMMTEEGARASTSTTTVAPEPEPASDPSNPWAHLPGKATETVAAANSDSVNKDNANDNAAAEAEDIQIAWENLEAARAIVEKMLLQATMVSTDRGEVAKLQLDLAQIHLREGDLQRINGNYTSAVGDYSSCLEILLRYQHTKDEQNQPRDLDRKIADTQFNLGLTYLTSSSDLQKEIASANANANSATDANANANAATSDQRTKAALLAREHCRKGIQQHVECARTFCGILAKLCGVDPDTIWDSSADTTDPSVAAQRDSKKPAAGFKTTGLYDDHDANNNTNTDSQKAATADASQTLNVWRKAIAKVVTSHSPADPLRVSDIRQVLDEIQETIDEAERSQEGVLQAATIKVAAQQAAAALGGDDDEIGNGSSSGAAVANPDGSTTTIGFGHGASAVAASAKAASTSTSDVNANANAKPMMVVKKKKKRKDAGDGSTGNEVGEATPTAQALDGDANKRAKTA